ncbi:MAG: hypothetical protein JEZ00_10215 [Anaerolineaceae bacterium]|nr:hypothetical protein [Anaerolineaceae bacterium]
MPGKKSQEEKQLIVMLEGFPVDEKKRDEWIAKLEENGLTEELAEEIRGALSNLSQDEVDAVKRTRYLIRLNEIVRRWRLSRQMGKFTKRGR